MTRATRAQVTLRSIRDQVIVITGASSGIGLATARLAAGRGARLVLAARSGNALQRLLGECAPGQAIAVVADVTSEADVQRIADEARRVFGGFDTWVNNAAVSAYGNCLDVPNDVMRRIMDTNFWGMVFGTRVACQELATRGGAIVTLGSAASFRGVPLQGIYSASKHAIKGWLDALRVELAASGAPVSITLIAPASVNTPYVEHAANYLEDHPAPAGAVYAPRSVARAILYAAEHPVREVAVGSGSGLLTVGNALVPALVDRAMADLIMPAMHSGKPPHGRPAVFTPSEDLKEEGEYEGLVRPSVYAAVQTHPAIATALMAAAGAMLLRRGTRAGRRQTARPARRSTGGRRQA